MNSVNGSLAANGRVLANAFVSFVVGVGDRAIWLTDILNFVCCAKYRGGRRSLFGFCNRPGNVKCESYVAWTKATDTHASYT